MARRFATPGYKVYRALLSQAASGAPSIESAGNGANTPFENSIGTIVWTRGGAGSYSGTLAGAFPQNKTFVGIPFIKNDGSNDIIVTVNEPDSIRITTGGADDILTNTPIEILVYN